MTFYQNRHLIVKGQSPEIGNLWLGDYQSARKKRQLKNDMIFSVLTTGLGMKISYTKQFNHKMLPLYDYDGQDIARFFEQIYPFIDESLKSGNLLIHCYAGVSRSTTILASYLMKKQGWNCKQTLSFMKKSRPYINPNKGFQRQLKKYEYDLNNIADNQRQLEHRVMPGKQKQFLQKLRVESRQKVQRINHLPSSNKKIREKSTLYKNIYNASDALMNVGRSRTANKYTSSQLH